MIGWIAVGVVVLALGAARYAWRAQASRGAADLEAAAVQLGLDGIAKEGLRQVRGHRDGVVVTLTKTAQGLVARCRADQPIALELGKNGALKRPLRGPDVTTGDAGFDGAVRVAGDARAILAFLSSPVRDVVRRLVGDGWTVAGGVWEATLDPTANIEAAVRAVIRLAARASASLDVAGELLDRVQTDPEVARAALAQIEEAETLAKIVARGTVPPAIRGAALVQLARSYPHHGETIAAVSLFADAARRLQPELAFALVKVLSKVPHPDPEGVVLALLEHHEESVHIAAAEGLGPLGTIERAVPALVPLRDRSGLLPFGARLRSAAAEAIATIQARAGDVAAGRLAVVDDVQGGALTVVEPGGEV